MQNTSVIEQVNNCNGMGVAVIVQHVTQLLLLMSCDDVLKFDWSC